MERQWKVKEMQWTVVERRWKGGGRSRKGSGRSWKGGAETVEGQGKADKHSPSENKEDFLGGEKLQAGRRRRALVNKCQEVLPKCWRTDPPGQRLPDRTMMCRPAAAASSRTQHLT